MVWRRQQKIERSTKQSRALLRVAQAGLRCCRLHPRTCLGAMAASELLWLLSWLISTTRKTDHFGMYGARHAPAPHQLSCCLHGGRPGRQIIRGHPRHPCAGLRRRRAIVGSRGSRWDGRRGGTTTAGEAAAAAV